MKRLPVAAFLPWQLALLFAVAVVFQAAALRRQAAATADAEADLAALRAEVFAVRDDLGDANDALDKQAQRIERIEGKATPKQAPIEPFDLHVAATVAADVATRTDPGR